MVIMTMTMIIVRMICISCIHAIHFISPKRIFKNMESRDDGDEDDDIDAIALQ